MCHPVCCYPSQEAIQCWRGRVIRALWSCKGNSRVEQMARNWHWTIRHLIHRSDACCIHMASLWSHNWIIFLIGPTTTSGDLCSTHKTHANSPSDNHINLHSYSGPLLPRPRTADKCRFSAIPADIPSPPGLPSLRQYSRTGENSFAWFTFMGSWPPLLSLTQCFVPIDIADQLTNCISTSLPLNLGHCPPKSNWVSLLCKATLIQLSG